MALPHSLPGKAPVEPLPKIGRSVVKNKKLGELHLSYIDGLIGNGTNFRVDRKDENASFRPASDSEADLQAFQPVVRDLRAHQGDGYDIHIEHTLSDHGDGLVDLVLVSLHKV